MSKAYQNILKNAISLSQSEQFALVQAILAQMKEEIDENPAMPWETDELFAELDRRMEELDSGKVKAIPGEEIMAKLKKRIG